MKLILSSINNLYKAVPKSNKTVSLYLDWSNSSTYIGEGKILEMTDFKPIIISDNPLIKNAFIYIRPRRCLCEIISSDKYQKGFKKHFVIPFKIPAKLANEILLMEERKFNKNNSNNQLNSNVISTIISFNNSLVDTLEEVEFSKEVLKLYKKNGITSEKFEEIKEKLKINLKERQDNINDIFDKLYPEKAGRLKKLRKRDKDEIAL